MQVLMQVLTVSGAYRRSTDIREKAGGKVEGKKKPTNEGGLNPYQRRHGGDRSKYSKAFGAMQHHH